MSARAAVAELIAKIEEAQPAIDDFEQHKKNRAKDLAENQAVKADTQRVYNIHKDIEARVNAKLAEEKNLDQQIRTKQNELARLHRQADELTTWLKITRFRHRVE